MNKLDAFKLGVENLKTLYRDSEKAATYMSDPNNWVLVHTTRYMPRKNENGQRYIPTTAMVSDFKVPRSTVHFTINQIVHSHFAGNWDDAPLVVLIPYNDAVKQNQKPEELASEDTYFSPDPNTGFVLPKSARIVQPAKDIPDGQLFIIDGNVTKYKNDNFSEAEIKTMLSLVDDDARNKYLQWESGDINENDLNMSMGKWDARTKKVYETAKDKKAFLRGMFEESRYEFLSKFMRDIAVYQTMQDMGYTKINGREDLSTRAVAEAAFKMGILGNSGDKGHSNSLYAGVEEVYVSIAHLLDELDAAKNVDEVYTTCADRIRNSDCREVIRAIAYDDVINIDMLCSWAFDDQIDYIKELLENDLKPDQRRWVENYIKAKSIADVDKNLDITIKRWSEKQQVRFEQTKIMLKSMPEYSDLIVKLKQLVVTEQARRANRDTGRNY